MAKTIDKPELLALLKRDVARYGSANAWAGANKVSISYISLVLSEKKLPGYKICRAIGYRPVLRYEKYEKV